MQIKNDFLLFIGIKCKMWKFKYTKHDFSSGNFKYYGKVYMQFYLNVWFFIIILYACNSIATTTAYIICKRYIYLRIIVKDMKWTYSFANPYLFVMNIREKYRMKGSFINYFSLFLFLDWKWVYKYFFAYNTAYTKCLFCISTYQWHYIGI